MTADEKKGRRLPRSNSIPKHYDTSAKFRRTRAVKIRCQLSPAHSARHTTGGHYMIIPCPRAGLVRLGDLIVLRTIPSLPCCFIYHHTYFTGCHTTTAASNNSNQQIHYNHAAVLRNNAPRWSAPEATESSCCGPTHKKKMPRRGGGLLVHRGLSLFL